MFKSLIEASVTSPAAPCIFSWRSFTSPPTAAYFLPSPSITNTSPGSQEPMAIYSGEFSPMCVCSMMSCRGGTNLKVLAEPTSVIPGVNEKTSLMKQGSYPNRLTAEYTVAEATFL